MAVHIIMSILPKNQLSFGAWSTSSWFGILFCCCWCWRTTRVIDRLTVDGLWLLEVSFIFHMNKSIDCWQESWSIKQYLGRSFKIVSLSIWWIDCLFVIASDWWRRRWFGFRPNKQINNAVSWCSMPVMMVSSKWNNETSAALNEILPAGMVNGVCLYAQIMILLY